MKTTRLLLTVLATTGAAAPVLADPPTITQTVQFNEGTFWSDFTYCYSVTVPANCTPVTSFCVTFHLGLKYIDTGTIQSPPGWVGAANAATNEICWTIATGGLVGATQGGFCVTTVCNPKCVEGIQSWDTYLRGVKSNSGKTRIALANHLHGDRQVNIGTQGYLGITNGLAPGGLAAVFVSAAPLPMPFPLPPFGQLQIDPNAGLALLSQMQLGANGIGGLNVPIPPDRNLVGRTVWFQGLGLLPQPLLSNRYQFDFR